MSQKKRSFARLILLIGLTGSVLAPLAAQARVDVDINVGPPPPRVVVVPPPRVGYVYAPGYWQWQGRAHVWVEGRWIAERPGRHWVPDHWVQHGPNWRFVPGHWAHNP